MSEKQLVEMARHAQRVLGNNHKVLLALAYGADAVGHVYSSKSKVGDIATQAGVCRRTVTTCLARLAQTGYIEITPGGRGAGRVHDIRLTIARGAQTAQINAQVPGVNELNKRASSERETAQKTRNSQASSKQSLHPKKRATLNKKTRNFEQINAQVPGVNLAFNGTLNGILKKTRSVVSLKAAREEPLSETKETEHTTLPPDFLISSSLLEWAAKKAEEHSVSLNVQLLADKFLHYYRAGPGRSVTQSDWGAYFERWVLGDIERGGHQVDVHNRAGRGGNGGNGTGAGKHDANGQGQAGRRGGSRGPVAGQTGWAGVVVDADSLEERGRRQEEAYRRRRTGPSGSEPTGVSDPPGVLP